MRGVDVIKNAVIALLLAYFVANAIPWVNSKGAICGAFLAAELAMYFLTAYDEMQRQRRKNHHGNRNRKH